jgi:L-ascorbate metabolism protein UlaG (beta-lactamase superfamily)
MVTGCVFIYLPTLSNHEAMLTGRHGYLIAFLDLKLTFLGDKALASGRQPHHDDTYLRVLGLHADAISLARHDADGVAMAQYLRSRDHESWKNCR